MNTTKHTEVYHRTALVAAAVVVIWMMARTVVPTGPEAAAAAQPQGDKELASHRVYLALRKDTGFADHQRLVTAMERARAQPADHGSLTLGDVLFTSGKADLKPGALGNLKNLVNFLGKYPDRRVAIRGYTDSLGSEEFNQGLSERRANSVKAYLAAQGIDSTRLSASGMGRTAPVAGNDSAAGRQQNRRVEVIISNPPAALTRGDQGDRTARLLVLLALLHSVAGGQGRPLL